MKKLILAASGMAALGLSMAYATDLPPRQVMPAKAAPVYVAPAPYDWTGLYYGAVVGGGWGRSDFSAPLATGGFGLSGLTASGVLGYNYQVNQIVFGVEGDIGIGNFRGSANCGALTCSTKSDWLATARGRIGYATDRFMPYVTGGAAFGNIRTTVPGLGDSSTNKTGWTIGGGVEAVLFGPWTAKVEYLYVDLGRGGPILGADARYNANIVRVGLNRRF
jgi:outer membrane immunogenic protein